MSRVAKSGHNTLALTYADFGGKAVGASRAGKSRPALLGSRTALIRGFSQ